MRFGNTQKMTPFSPRPVLPPLPYNNCYKSIFLQTPTWPEWAQGSSVGIDKCKMKPLSLLTLSAQSLSTQGPVTYPKDDLDHGDEQMHNTDLTRISR